MKLSVLTEQSYYNCFHSNICTCANYLNRELEMLFSTTLNFIYHPMSETCGKSIVQYYDQPNGEMPDSTNEFLYKYNGIRIALQQDLTWDNFLCLVTNEELKQRPVVLHFNTFYAPWSKLYNKEHSSEFIIITQIGKETVTLFDPYHKKAEIVLSKYQLQNSLIETINVWKFELNEQVSTLNEDAILSHIQNYYLYNNFIDLIIQFAKKVLKTFDYETEVLAYEEIEESPLIKNLKQLSYFRLVHIEFLSKIIKYINDEHNKKKILHVINLLKSSVQSWDKLRAVMIYKKIRNDLSSKNEWIYNKLNDIAELENEVLSTYAQFEVSKKTD